MVFPTFFNFSLNLSIRSSWSKPLSAPGLIFADCIELLHLQLQNITTLILKLVIWSCPCVELSPVLLAESVCYERCILLAKLCYPFFFFFCYPLPCFILYSKAWVFYIPKDYCKWYYAEFKFSNCVSLIYRDMIDFYVLFFLWPYYTRILLINDTRKFGYEKKSHFGVKLTKYT